MTQTQMFYAAHRRIADRDHAFMELVNHPTNPLTNDDLQKLIARHPVRYGRYSGYLGKLKVSP